MWLRKDPEAFLGVNCQNRSRSLQRGIEMVEKQVGVGGTLIWYYFICKRQVWLISHQLTPDQDDTNIVIGRLIDRTSYGREIGCWVKQDGYL